MTDARIKIRAAARGDATLILSMIGELAEYEELTHECVATEGDIMRHLFGDEPAAEALIGELDGEPAGFALYFRNFSTFLGRPGIYLEDLFVRPIARGHGLGKALLVRLAQICIEHHYGRLEWSVLKWNQPSIDFYLSQGAVAMDEWTVYRVTGAALDHLAGQ